MEPSNSHPLVDLPGTRGNPPVTLNDTQLMILPYVQAIELVLWSLWCAILITMIVKHLVFPAVTSRARQGK